MTSADYEQELREIVNTAYEVVADCLREHPLWPNDRSGLRALDTLVEIITDLREGRYDTLLADVQRERERGEQ